MPAYGCYGFAVKCPGLHVSTWELHTDNLCIHFCQELAGWLYLQVLASLMARGHTSTLGPTPEGVFSLASDILREIALNSGFPPPALYTHHTLHFTLFSL